MERRRTERLERIKETTELKKEKGEGVYEKEDVSMKEGKWSEKKELRSLKGINL